MTIERHGDLVPGVELHAPCDCRPGCEGFMLTDAALLEKMQGRAVEIRIDPLYIRVGLSMMEQYVQQG